MVTFDPNKSLHQILQRRFDYAGMFPPASLSFEAALSESAHHAATLSRPWIVGTDLVLDTAHTKLLSTLDPKQFRFSRVPNVAVLVNEGVTTAIEAAKAISEPSPTQQYRVVALETKVSASTFPILVKELCSYAREISAIVAVEPDLSTSDWREVLGDIIAEITKSPMCSLLALKCRCTGPTGIGPSRLASTIAAAADVGIGFKVTGGLHHPIVEPQVHEYPMGFLNVACALYLRRALREDFSEQSIVSLLTNSSVEQLSFANGIRFNSAAISHEQLIQAQRLAPFTIGSCSIQEPDQDLARLGVG
jgi:hypothetical protein